MQLRRGLFLLSLVAVALSKRSVNEVRSPGLIKRGILENEQSIDFETREEALGYISGIFSGIPIIEDVVDNILVFITGVGKRKAPVKKPAPPPPPPTAPIVPLE
ncbi:hypothetical protein K7432_002215 [Basidiobolus ranarum]|uniref:Uncharacterized protein n=1 Tax=Basidiobolus ranarum TaxID=34480 RepID=A0ABR2X1T9_9FUNG